MVNSAGVIAAACEYFKRVGQNPMKFELNETNVMKHIEKIGDTLGVILKKADAENITPAEAADALAEAVFDNDSAQASSF